MPAHIGLGDQLTWRLGAKLQDADADTLKFASKHGFSNAAGVAGFIQDANSGMHNSVALKNTGLMDANGRLKSSGIAVGLEADRRNREIVCLNYDAYRQRLSDFTGEEFWKSGLSHNTLVQMSALSNTGGPGSKVDLKAGARWQAQNDLYFARGTDMDNKIQQYFVEGWVVLLIRGHDNKYNRLKRVEAVKLGAGALDAKNRLSSNSKIKKTKILWTA